MVVTIQRNKTKYTHTHTHTHKLINVFIHELYNPVVHAVEHGASNAKVIGSIPKECMNW